MKKYSLLFLACCMTSFVFSQPGKTRGEPDRIIDSLKKVLLTAREDTGHIDNLNMLSRSYIELADYSRALSCAEEAVALSEKLLSETTAHKGVKKIKSSLSDACNNLGLIYFYLGIYDKSIRSSFRSLSLGEELGNKKGMASCYNNIGMVYFRQGNYDKALEFYTSSGKINMDIGNKKMLGKNYSNIGLIYLNKGLYDKALDAFRSALKIKNEINDKQGIAYACGQIGNIYELQKNYSEALNNYNIALQMLLETGNKKGVSEGYANIGNLYQSVGNFAEALKFFNKTLEICKEIGYKEGIKNVYAAFSKIDSTRGDHKSAFVDYKMYISYRDSLINDENTRKTVQAQMQYEFDKKEGQTKAEQVKKDAVTKIVIWSISGGLFLVLVLAGFIFRSFKQKQKVNIIITRQKQEVEKQKLLVEEKQKDILDSIHYAKRIQRSLLPTEKYIDKHLGKSTG